MKTANSFFSVKQLPFFFTLARSLSTQICLSLSLRPRQFFETSLLLVSEDSAKYQTLHRNSSIRPPRFLLLQTSEEDDDIDDDTLLCKDSSFRLPPTPPLFFGGGTNLSIITNTHMHTHTTLDT